ncbi:peptidylprolyl isomerase [Vogesella indigofera]|uniref:peptidylprolyl isomerase n=1 Tax=Vogesella indigofera TaxID=45465 RepID=UPI00234EE140|nr:peptidylprolyl isomerase [Vogesella indigofera]MDC7707188.1 peptidylprolyl isomerase [Vogesella indigofera]
MNFPLKKTLIAVSLLTATACAFATSVNGVAISQQRIDAITRMMEAQGQKSTPEMAKMIKDKLITTEILRQEAVKKGLDKSADYLAEIEFAKATILATHLFKEHLRTNPVTDAQIRAEYDKVKAEFPERKSFDASHILVKTEAEAKAVIEALKKGKPFAQLAKEKSLDPGSKDNGGSLGLNEPGTFEAPFSEAMVKLAKGQVTATPVKTNFGFHVIKLNAVKVEAAPPLEALRPQLEQHIQSQRIEALIKSLEASAKVQ